MLQAESHPLRDRHNAGKVAHEQHDLATTWAARLRQSGAGWKRWHTQAARATIRAVVPSMPTLMCKVHSAKDTVPMPRIRLNMPKPTHLPLGLR